MILNKPQNWIPQAIATAFLVIAIARKNPYDFYLLLRWVCFSVFLFLAWVSYQKKKHYWVWVFAVLVVLYNPIFKVTFKRETWEWINGATIGILALSVFRLNKPLKDY